MTLNVPVGMYGSARFPGDAVDAPAAVPGEDEGEEVVDADFWPKVRE
jgi:hypothetical protein